MKRSILSKTALAIAAIAFALAFSACGDKNAKRFKDAAMNLDQTQFTFGWEYDYWPNGGIRNIGGHLASLISLQELQQLLPCPLYLSGPHHNGQWNLNSDDYGRYNPEAINYLADLAQKVVSDKKFIQASAPLVEKYLGLQMHIMMVLHDVMYDENLYDEDTRNSVFAGIVERYGFNDDAMYIVNSINVEDREYLYTNFSYEMLYWWARRYSDGTIDEFYRGLSTIYKAYYPDYAYDLDSYWIENGGGEWFEGDEGWYYEDGIGETVYAIELESDEPIADDERIKENDAVDLIKKAVSKLDETYLVLPDEFDYWPKSGLRVMGGHLFSLISLRTLNRILPCDLYLSGPHHVNRWNLDHPYDFGYYNPEAITYLGNLAKKVVADEKFVETSKPLVDQYLKLQITIMKGLYDGLNDGDYCADKEAILNEIVKQKGRAYYGSNTFDFLSQFDFDDEDSYAYSNTGEMFLYWWGRRNVDGTMEQFHDILETVYSAYYPE